MTHWGYGGVSAWGAAFTAISMVLLWVLITVIIIALIRSMLSSARPAMRGTSVHPSAAEQILAERFARGDIDEEDYRRRVEALRASTGSSSTS